MYRCVLTVSLVAAACVAADAADCESTLQGVELLDNTALSATCRAFLNPALCKELKQSLGPKPWSKSTMQSACAKFKEHQQAGDVPRNLEQALNKKNGGGQPMDTTVAAKVPVPVPPVAHPSKEPPLVQSMLGHLKKAAEKDEKALKKGSLVPDLLKKLKDAKTEEKAARAEKKVLSPKKSSNTEKSDAEKSTVKKAVAKKPPAEKVSTHKKKKNTEAKVPSKVEDTAQVLDDANVDKTVKLFRQVPDAKEEKQSSVGIFGLAVAVASAFVLLMVIRRNKAPRDPGHLVAVE